MHSLCKHDFSVRTEDGEHVRWHERMAKGSTCDGYS